MYRNGISLKWHVFKTDEPMYGTCCWVAERDRINWFFETWDAAYNWAIGWHRLDA